MVIIQSKEKGLFVYGVLYADFTERYFQYLTGVNLDGVVKTVDFFNVVNDLTDILFGGAVVGGDGPYGIAVTNYDFRVLNTLAVMCTDDAGADGDEDSY